VRVEAPDSVQEVVPLGALTVLLHALLDHAIGASPPGSEILVTLSEQPSAIEITVDDVGAAIPPSARSVILSRDFEAIAHGRASSLPLIAAHAIAAHARLPLSIEDGPDGGARVRLTLPRSG
jgi:signal transduction histidine kinase